MVRDTDGAPGHSCHSACPEVAEQGDGASMEGHAAPANWPVAERHNESGEHAGDYGTCKCAADAGSRAEQHDGASANGGGRDKSHRNASSMRGRDATGCTSGASEQLSLPVGSAGAGECSAAGDRTRGGPGQFDVAMGSARERMVLDNNSVRRAARAAAGADCGGRSGTSKKLDA